MTCVVGVDPGTISIDICGLRDGELTLDLAVPTAEALAEPERFLNLLRGSGPVDLIAGPSGYGLPLRQAAGLSEEEFRLAFLAVEGDPGGIGGLRRLMRSLANSGLPVLLTPGVMHLPTVPAHRKLNRVDLGTADKVAAAVLGIADHCARFGRPPTECSFILLELGGAFTSALAIEDGQIVDGFGGTSGSIGWRSSGAWDGEVAFLAERVTKDSLFRGGAVEAGHETGRVAYVEGAAKAVRALMHSVRRPREILLSGRNAGEPQIRGLLDDALHVLAPVRDLTGFAKIAKQGAQGAAIMADGLAGGVHSAIVERLGLREASGTVLDHLLVISKADARRRLGLA
ncbi:MAG: DUF1464 family protein [Gemmatimonadota bacterium]